MQITVFSFLTSLICFCLFFSFFLLIKRTSYIMANGVFLAFALITLCFIRLTFSFEFPFAVIISSTTVLPAIMSFFRTRLFALWGMQITVTTVVAAIWAAVSAVLLLKLAVNLVQYRKMLNGLAAMPNPAVERIMSELVFKTKPRQKYRLICSEAVATPTVSGFFSPTICLPALSFSESELNAILAHEWTHFRYGDTWSKLLFFIARALLWWNPLLHVLYKDLDQMLEVRCDINNTYACNDIEKVKYLESILHIIKKTEEAGQKQPVSSVAFIGNSRSESIKQRFNVVLGYKKRLSGSKRIITCCAMTAVLMLSYCFVVQAAFAPPDNEHFFAHSEINNDNSFIGIKPDGSYMLYFDGVFMGEITGDSIFTEPFSSLPRIELSK